ncbi:MAG: hypothetical protein AAF828_07115 [Bacteroidota bacterium]
MKDTQDRNRLKAWLDSIQQDSWQLELLISGFVIFLLLGIWGPIVDFEYKIELLISADKWYFFIQIGYYILRTAYQALLVCLIIHIVLRGLWIAAVGLRYVSGEIDYDELRYQPKYRQWLEQRVGSFDDYIERLEKYCSILFSLAFLIIFCFMSLVTYFTLVALLQVLLSIFRYGYQERVIDTGDNFLGIFSIIIGILYLIDFATLGFFKRNKWTARPYYYLYRLMGWITLARFYRPIYYNLADNRFGRRLARLLPVFVLLSLSVVSLQFVKYSYFPYYTEDGKTWIDQRNYDDARQGDLLHNTWRVTLNSKYPQNDYLEVFTPYRPRWDDLVLQKRMPDLEVARFKGVKLAGAFKIGDRYNEAANYDSMLVALTTIHHIYIDDSLRTDIKPRFHFHEGRNQPGLLYMVPTHGMPRGEHTVRVEKEAIRADTLLWPDRNNIYFYK